MHAAVKHALRRPTETRATPTVVVLEGPCDDDRLGYLMARFPNAVPFFEPDFDDELTAFAVVSDGVVLRHLPLLFDQRKEVKT